MKPLKFLISRKLNITNPVQLKIEASLFFRIFILTLVGLRINTILYQLAHYQNPNLHLVFVLRWITNESLFLFNHLLFLLGSFLILLGLKPTRIIRSVYFVSYFIVVGYINSFGKVNYVDFSTVIVLFFMTLLSDKDFFDKDKLGINKNLFYSLIIVLSVYTISGFHKLTSLVPCLIAEECSKGTSFLSFQIFNNAFILQSKVPLDFIFTNLSPRMDNFLFLFLSMFEFISFFMIFSKRFLKFHVVGLVLLHLGIAFFMQVYFTQFIMVHLLYLAFCFDFSGVSPSSVAQVNCK